MCIYSILAESPAFVHISLYCTPIDSSILHVVYMYNIYA